jgi:hypothetical protein
VYYDVLAADFLVEAQRLFGPKCNDWLMSSVEIEDSVPHLKYYPETGYISISLSEKVISDDLQLRFQLAHEICHLLYPQYDRKTFNKEEQNVLNEGISTWYSIYVIKDRCDIEGVLNGLKISAINYYNAYILTKELIDIDNRAIIKVREIQPKVNLLTIDNFIMAKLNIRRALINDLLNKFL